MKPGNATYQGIVKRFLTVRLKGDSLRSAPNDDSPKVEAASPAPEYPGAVSAGIPAAYWNTSAMLCGCGTAPAHLHAMLSTLPHHGISYEAKTAGRTASP